jgi:hypothetical protein
VHARAQRTRRRRRCARWGLSPRPDALKRSIAARLPRCLLASWR